MGLFEALWVAGLIAVAISARTVYLTWRKQK